MGGLISANQFQLVPDAGSFSRGLNLGNQFQQSMLKRKQEDFLKGDLSQPDTIANAAKLGLDFQAKVASGLGLQDERTGQIKQKELTEAADFAFRIENLPEEQQNIAINKRVEILEGQRRDATNTRDLLTVPYEQRRNVLGGVQLAALPAEKRAEFIASGGKTKFQFGGQESFKDDAGNVFFATTQRDPRTGDVAPKVTPLVEGTQVQGKLVPLSGSGLTTTEKVEQERLITENKARAAAEKEIKTATAKRKQGFVNSGVEAADSAANVKRSLELLETVSTGGVDAASLRAKQLFGIESADEAELSAGLGKAILSQLRPIFGAAFTENEGKRLERIEAGFGKSTEGNRRLLKQLLSIVDRSARRGIAAAESLGDDFTAREIEKALEFELTPEPEQDDEDQQFKEGQTATNAQGQKIIYQNGQWSPLDG